MGISWQDYGLTLSDYGFEPDDGPSGQPRCERCGAFMSYGPREEYTQEAIRPAVCDYLDACSCPSGQPCTKDPQRAAEVIKVCTADFTCSRCGHGVVEHWEVRANGFAALKEADGKDPEF